MATRTPPTASAPIQRRRGRRPRIPGALASERIWAWLTPEERLALAAVSDETGTPIAALIRDAVNEYVADFSDRKIFRHG